MAGCQTTKPASGTKFRFAESIKGKSQTIRKKKQGKTDQSANPQGPALASAQAMQIPIGTIHLVDEVGEFVLIKSSRTTTLEEGTEIFTYGPDARMTSRLKASPARKGAYLTADIESGLPASGDMAMMLHSLRSSSQSSQKLKPGGTPSGEVQVLE